MENLTSLPFSIRDSGSAFISQYAGPSPLTSASSSASAATAGFSLIGTSTETLDFSLGAEASSSSVVVLADFPRFRLLVASTLVAVLVAVFFAVLLTEVLVAFLLGLSGTGFPLIELLVERGAAASASEVLLGLDDDAVGSMTFFGLFVAGASVLSAVVFALRLAGAMVSVAIEYSVSKTCDSEV